MSPSGAQLEEVRIEEKLAALPLLIRDPVRFRLEATHQEAHHTLEGLAGRDVTELSARRARNRLRQVRRLMAYLNRTDHVHDDVPCREERVRLVGPTIAALAKLAKGTRSPRRERQHPVQISEQPQPPKETPMTERLFNPGGIVEERPEDTARREQADAARRAAAETRGIPETVVPYLRDFDNCWRVAQTEAVREHRARELAKAILNQPERDRAPLVAWVIHRLARRNPR
jgi:hypothetical protein